MVVGSLEHCCVVASVTRCSGLLGLAKVSLVERCAVAGPEQTHLSSASYRL